MRVTDDRPGHDASTGAGRMPPEDHGRPPESASFEATRVGGGQRTQAPIVIVAFVVLLGAIVAIGLGGQGQSGATAILSGGAPSPAVGPSLPAPTPGEASGPPPGTTSIPAAPRLTSGPGPIQLVAQRSTGGMFVHGDVFVPRVTWVYVSLTDDAGNVAGWASVSVPGAAGPGQGSGPTLRFDVELALPAQFDGRLWISANAYDTAGALITGTRLEVAGSLRPSMQFEP